MIKELEGLFPSEGCKGICAPNVPPWLVDGHLLVFSHCVLGPYFLVGNQSFDCCLFAKLCLTLVTPWTV